MLYFYRTVGDLMLEEQRKIVYDDKLNVESLSFIGIHQSFAKHFHDYYVIGIVRKGNRRLICNSNKYNLQDNSVLLINPNDYHECEGINEEQLDYSAIHIPKDVMSNLVMEIFKSKKTVVFKKSVVYDESLLDSIEELNNLLMMNTKTLEKEKLFYIMLKESLEKYADFKTLTEETILKTKEICAYIEKRYSDDVTLDELSKIGCISKYHLIRLFTKEKGITPYKYLELYRINKAKQLLQNDKSILEVAMQCGFSDQSHFTNLFKKTIGITPKQYQIIFEERKNQNE